MERKNVVGFAFSIGILCYAVAVWLIVDPSTFQQSGYVYILWGVAGIAFYPFVPEGIKGGRWDTQKRKREMLLGGIGTIIFGLMVVFLLR